MTHLYHISAYLYRCPETGQEGKNDYEDEQNYPLDKNAIFRTSMVVNRTEEITV